jgi:hypothetical protein
VAGLARLLVGRRVASVSCAALVGGIMPDDGQAIAIPDAGHELVIRFDDGSFVTVPADRPGLRVTFTP